MQTIRAIQQKFQQWPEHRRGMLPYALLVLAVALVYADVYPNMFLLDDQALIITNTFLQSWSHIRDIFTHSNYAGAGQNQSGFYRPLPMVLHLLIYQVFGLSTIAFHTLNILVHMLNACLIYKLGRKLGFIPAGVFAATLLWAVHPLHVEAVAYMSSTPELLWVTFSLAGLLAILPAPTPRKTALAAFCFLLALGCKETAVVFPALAVACLFAAGEKERFKPALYIGTWPLWLMSALYAALYFHFNTKQQFFAATPLLAAYGAHITVRLMTSLATLPVYLGLILYPTALHMERTFDVFVSPWSWKVIGGFIIVLAALLQMALGRGRRGAALSFGLFWFAAALSPATGILTPVDATIFEHWMYMPTIGLFLGAAEMVAQHCLNVQRLRTPAIVLVSVAALLLGAKTIRQNKIWRTPVTFYDNIFACHGYPNRAYPDLGIYYLNKGKFDKSIKFFKLAIAFPDKHNVPLSVLHMQLALAYLHVRSNRHYLISPQSVEEALAKTPDIPEAVAELKTATKLDPHNNFAYAVLSMIYHWKGDNEKASFYYEKIK